MSIISHFPCGGESLNYSVRAYEAAPVGTGNPNEIAIITNVAIMDIQLNCVSTPTTRSDGTPLQTGDVYIGFLISTGVRFNALKKNALYVCPRIAYQHTGSSWQSKDAYIYQNGSWAPLSDLPAPGTPLNDYTWFQIQKVGVEGLQQERFSVGDEKTITLSTGEVVTLQIIGFSHDNLVAGGKAPITFGFKNCMQTTRQINPTNTNVGGYSGCTLYPTINDAIYNSLPSDLRAVMKSVSKRTSAGNQSSTIVTTQEKLFLLSEVEIFGSVVHSKTGEGTQYPFFTNGGTRIKTLNGNAIQWWERSPRSDSATTWCDVDAAGAAHYVGTINTRGIAPGLCV